MRASRGGYKMVKPWHSYALVTLIGMGLMGCRPRERKGWEIVSGSIGGTKEHRPMMLRLNAETGRTDFLAQVVHDGVMRLEWQPINEIGSQDFDALINKHLGHK